MHPLPRIASLSAIIVALAAVPGSAQKTNGPIARYAMDVETTSGFGANMNVGSMLFGGKGDKTAYRLDLRLGSSRAPTNAPIKADHFFLPAAKLGKSVPLLGPEPGTARPGEDGKQMPQGMEKPKGRLLLFWGCGAKAPKGQPIVIDFNKIAAGQMPPNLWTSKVPVDRGPSQSNSTYYAHWPNPKSGKQPTSGSSLLGAHRIAANFAPEINFTLTQDYMPALNATHNEQAGVIQINWNALPPATGYIAWAMGGNMAAAGGQSGDMVWWTSSATRDFGGGLWDWLPPATVQKLVAEKTVMPPSQTSCQIPAEVKTAAGGMLFGNLNAFGPEANFSYPPKPDNPKAIWNIDWTARIRYRSSTTLMLMEGMGGMGNMGNAGSEPAKPPEKKKCKGPFGVTIPCPF